MKEKYPLPLLLTRLQLAKSSYYYQIEITRCSKEDEVLSDWIKTLFQKNSGRYGYRRIHALLAREGKRISEKVVRRIMAKEGLVAVPSRRKASIILMPARSLQKCLI